MSAAARMPVLHQDARAAKKAAEDVQFTQHRKQVAAAYAAFKKSRRVKP